MSIKGDYKYWIKLNIKRVKKDLDNAENLIKYKDERKILDKFLNSIWKMDKKMRKLIKWAQKRKNRE